MDKPISVGDVVMVIRPKSCGCSSDVMGQVFTVLEITDRKAICKQCRIPLTGPHAITGGPLDGFAWIGHQVFRLKRIPPKEELDGQRDASGLDEKLGDREYTPTAYRAYLRDLA